MKITRPIQLLAILALGVLGAVTAGVVAQASTTKTTINVTEREYSIKLSAQKAPIGLVHLVIHNRGKYAHAIVVKEGSLSKRTPLIKPGKSATPERHVQEGKGCDLVPRSRTRRSRDEDVARRRDTCRACTVDDGRHDDHDLQSAACTRLLGPRTRA